MTQIDFFILKQGTPGDRLLLTYHLVERLYQDRLRVLIYTPDLTMAGHLDRLLWTYRQQSFIPHGLVGEVDEELTPVLISRDGAPLSEHQVLINLDAAVPPFFSRFERLYEPIDHDATVRAAGRERYAHYRDRGYPLAHREIELRERT